MKFLVFVSLCLLGLVTASPYGNLRESVVDPTSFSTNTTETFCDDVKQYSGYYDIDSSTNKHYFYWAFESRGNPSTDPVVLWLTGGPGCSSELALFVENGPCSVNKDGASTTKNPYSWNSNANLVYVDQPAGTGFSYSDLSGYDSSEKEVAEDMFHFLQELFKAHPDWQDNQFFIFGESYAGHYVPAVSHRVYVGNKNNEGIHLPLEGVAIGNGLTDPQIQYKYYGQLAYNWTKTVTGSPAISLETYEQMQAAVPSCIDAITKCQTDDSACSGAQRQCNSALMTPYQETGKNVYDIRKPCGSNPLCYDFSNVKTFLQDPRVLKTLNVTSASAKWSSCNFVVNGMFSNDWMKNYQDQLPDLLNANIRVMIYSGDCDFICNWLGNKAWTLDLAWPGKNDFNAAQDHPWQVDGKEAGIARTAKNFTFLQVHQAGHMVPMDQPNNALVMLQTFLKGGQF